MNEERADDMPDWMKKLEKIIKEVEEDKK